MSNSNPLISISCLSYNTGPYVIEALNCVKQQTYKNYEIVIVDDASKDNTAELIDKWISENPEIKITFIKNSSNQGITKNLNVALSYLHGDYYTGICDDLWTPDKLEHQLKLMQSLPEDYKLIYGDITLFDSDTGKEYYGTQINGPLFSVPEGSIFENLLVNPIPFVSFMFRMDVFKDIGYYDEELSFDDWDLTLRLSKKYKIKFDNKIVAKYRIRNNGLHKTMHQDLHNETCLRIYNKHWGYSALGDKIIKDKIDYWLQRSIRTNPKMARPYIKDFYKRTKSNPLLYFFSILRLPGNLYYWLRITIEMIKKRKIEINYLDL
jgi:glycosyltransferase involved in cell wall biosynthesis